MIVFDGVGGLVMLGLWIFCFIDVITTPEASCRNLPKLVWLFIVLLLPLVGSIAWLVAGRAWDQAGAPARRGASAARFPEYDRSNRHIPSNPDDDAEFLAGLRKRTEEQRRRAREQNPERFEGEQS